MCIALWVQFWESKLKCGNGFAKRIFCSHRNGLRSYSWIIFPADSKISILNVIKCLVVHLLKGAKSSWAGIGSFVYLFVCCREMQIFWCPDSWQSLLFCSMVIRFLVYIVLRPHFITVTVQQQVMYHTNVPFDLYFFSAV